MKLKVLPRTLSYEKHFLITKLTFASSFVVNGFFESPCITVLVNVFSHAFAFLQHGVLVFTKLNVLW